MLKSYKTLLSINLIEEQIDNDVDVDLIDDMIDINNNNRYLWRWTYPSIDNDVRFFIEKRLSLQSSSSSSLSTIFTYDYGKFSFFKIREKFIYILQNYQQHSKRFSLVLLTKDFYPKYYQKLLKIFAKIFIQSNDSIVELLDKYLTLLITDRIEMMLTDPERQIDFHFQQHNDEFNEKQKLQSKLRSIIKMFSLDIILIYTALLLKKRIIIYGNDSQLLFEFAITLPLFIKHRQNILNEEFIPNVDLQCPIQINDLRYRQNFISTFNDPRIEEHEDLYDIYINLATIEITISHRAKEIFMMTKMHKDVAITFVRIAEKQDTTDQDVVDEISKKTNELLNTLYSSSAMDDDYDDDNQKKIIIKKSKLKEKFSSPNLQQFFFNLALAESISII
ncbi:Protein fam45a [Dermatophagoides pteronyssinus]|uniref:Protein fam45a n=1 Tax=Dermatophagoides pteronyssinus TaxID=6956 RepID=A0ABQ8IRQ7_DERPT|nr:Protein fam45a [Dermatophagoides pteronyssinus]